MQYFYNINHTNCKLYVHIYTITKSFSITFHLFHFYSLFIIPYEHLCPSPDQARAPKKELGGGGAMGRRCHSKPKNQTQNILLGRASPINQTQNILLGKAKSFKAKQSSAHPWRAPFSFWPNVLLHKTCNYLRPVFDRAPSSNFFAPSLSNTCDSLWPIGHKWTTELAVKGSCMLSSPVSENEGSP